MTRTSYWIFHISNILVAGTGLFYGWMRYLCKPDNEFSVVNHPWQPTLQHLHVLAAPFLVGMLGYLWGKHFLPHWRWKIERGRNSGLGLALLAVPMVVSGYLVQTTISEFWRLAWVWIHGISGTLWILVSLVHVLLHWSLRRSD